MKEKVTKKAVKSTAVKEKKANSTTAKKAVKCTDAQEKVNKKQERGKTTKEKIFQESFKLFMNKPYLAVTVSDIEKAVGVTRGAIFHHVDNKLDLFEKVIEKYFLDTQNIYHTIGEDILEKDITLLEFIDTYVSALEKKFNALYALYNIDRNIADKHIISKAECSYFALLASTTYYYDNHNYIAKMHENFQTHRNTWRFFIQKAVETGEVKPNTNAKSFAKIFTSIYMGKFFYDAFDEGINEEELKELLLEIYNKIKA
jgi:AcrR family transcriptional regulator